MAMSRSRWLCATLLPLAVITSAATAADQVPTAPGAPPAAFRLTLEEAKQRALANNKLLDIGRLNAQSKCFAIKAAQSDYFPKVVGSVFYFHFDDPLGDVLSTQGRTITGLNRQLVLFPPTTVDVAVLNQDSSFANVGVVQPITDLLKVRQGVNLARADEAIAQAQLLQGTRKLVSGVEQLFWGLLAARRIQGGAVKAVAAGEQLARTGLLEGRIALAEARQARQAVDAQIADLQDQMDALLDLPAGTTLDLVEPPLPIVPFHSVDDAVGLALGSSPEVRIAEQDVAKAHAALKAGKLDYVPSIAAVGGYVNQTGADYIQQNIGYVGVVGTYTFVDWGKRRNVIHERQNLVAMANLKLQQTRETVQQDTVKAFREVGETQEALKLAQEVAALHQAAVKQATTPQAIRDPAPLIKASKDLIQAELDAIKAELAYRQAYVKLMILVGQ